MAKVLLISTVCTVYTLLSNTRPPAYNTMHILKTFTNMNLPLSVPK